MSEEREKLSQRKADHVELAKSSQVKDSKLNQLFDYEPLLSGFPQGDLTPTVIAGKKMSAPIWVSSMTGGTGEAAHINKNLATVCREFGLGMGLGSCRSLLESDEFFNDFALRKALGDDAPFFANIGLAQVTDLLGQNKLTHFIDLCHRLEVDGFFVHINPLQEYYQPEGDRWYLSPLDIIDEVLNLCAHTSLKVSVKEVGQGMGPRSLEALLKRPLSFIEFAAFGGTNFSLLETLRSEKRNVAEDLCYVGHTCNEMLSFVQDIYNTDKNAIKCESLIISGGVRSFLQGHHLIQKSPLPAVYGMATPFLKHANIGLDETRLFVQQQISGLKMASHFLHPRKEP